MKKLMSDFTALIAIMVLSVSTFSAYAQSSHVSILINNVNSRLNYGAENRSLQGYRKDVRGLQAGLSWQAGLSKHFSVVTEAYFVKKGGALKSGNPLNGMNSSLKLHTVEMPVMARVHAGRLYFNAGPYVNYIVSGKNYSDVEGTQKISFGPDGYKKWEMGVQGGAGYEFLMKKTRMALDVRYTHGLTSIAADKDMFSRTININILVHRSWKKQG